jgi:hypothetical protein
MDFDSVGTARLNDLMNDPSTQGNSWVRAQRDAMAPRETLHDLADLPSLSDIAVDRESVLRAARIIQDVLDTHGEQVQRKLQALTIAAPADDPVSTESARAWNDLLVNDADSFANRVREYLTGLQNLVVNLTETARAYGYTDDEITAVMGRLHAATDSGGLNGH